MNEEKEQNRFRFEARRIYRTLFSRECPECLESRYEQAVLRLYQRLSEEEILVHQALMDKVTDWEALEMAARWRGCLAPLTDKYRIMIFLAETLPENYNAFIVRKTWRLLGWMALVGAGLRSIWKLLKGMVLLLGLKKGGKND